MSAEMTDIKFRPLVYSDLRQLGLWLRTEHVARWWDDDTSDEAVAERYFPRQRNSDDASYFIILYADKPVGMIQAYPANHLAQKAYGIDLILGVPELTGRGISPAIIRSFVSGYVFGHYGASVCIADPEAANIRSVRAFEKAGFVTLQTFEEGAKLYLLMQCRNSN
jgi:aminoglycoside 6'-N-acetyltransferase